MKLTSLRCAALLGATLIIIAQASSANPKIAAAVFAGMDTNADGAVSADEHAAATQIMFTIMDGNADGSVTATEMSAARETITGKKAKPGDLSSAVKIKVIDSNSDRVLSVAEHIAGSVLMFGKMDANKDAKLTRAEFAAGHRRVVGKAGKY